MNVRCSFFQPLTPCVTSFGGTFLLIALMAIAPFSSVHAQSSFEGTLKSVSITDAQSNNAAPIADFTYTATENSVSLDASGSYDSDGSIAQYLWDFSDGSSAEGVSTSHTLVAGTPLTVTLTVIDDQSAVTLSQKVVSPITAGISDDFSTDSSGDYVVFAGKGLAVYDGALHTGEWNTTLAYYNESTGSNDHTVEADVTYQPEYGGGLILRHDPGSNTGYLAHFESGRLLIKSFQNDTASFVTMHIGNYAAGTYRLKVAISGNTINASVNGKSVLSATDSTYTSGAYTGVRLRAGSDTAAIWVDNFSAQ